MEANTGHMLRVCPALDPSQYYVIIYARKGLQAKLISFVVDASEVPTTVNFKHMHTRHDVPVCMFAYVYFDCLYSRPAF